MLSKAPFFIAAIVIVAAAVWFVGEIAGRKDNLRREASLLRETRRRWVDAGSPEGSAFDEFVLHRRPGIFLVNSNVVVGGVRFLVELGYHSQSFPGDIVVTSNEQFLWIEPPTHSGSSNTFKVLQLPKKGEWRWYLKSH